MHLVPINMEYLKFKIYYYYLQLFAEGRLGGALVSTASLNICVYLLRLIEPF